MLQLKESLSKKIGHLLKGYKNTPSFDKTLHFPQSKIKRFVWILITVAIFFVVGANVLFQKELKRLRTRLHSY